MNNLHQLQKELDNYIQNPNSANQIQIKENITNYLHQLETELDHIEFQTTLIDSVLLKLVNTYNKLKLEKPIETKARLENKRTISALETFMVDLAKVFKSDLKDFEQFKNLGDKIHKYNNSNKNHIFKTYTSNNLLSETTLSPPSLQKGKIKLSYELTKKRLTDLLARPEDFEYDRAVILEYHAKCTKTLTELENTNKSEEALQKKLISDLINFISEQYPSIINTQPEKTEKPLDENPFPQYFTSTGAYKVFKEFVDSIETKTQLADYSFIYRIMLQEGHIIESLGDSDYRNFLDKNFEITIEKTKTLERSTTTMKMAFYKSLKEQHYL